MSFNIDNLILTFSTIWDWTDLYLSGQIQIHFSKVGNRCNEWLYTQPLEDSSHEWVVKKRMFSCCPKAQSTLSSHLLIKEDVCPGF